MNEIIGQTWLASILTQLVDVGGVLDGAKVHLFKNDIMISPTTLVADLVEADYTGYAASGAIVWGSPYLDAGGNGLVVGDLKQFHPTGTAVQNDIYGYWLMPTIASTAPIKVVKFSSPVPMTGPLSGLLVTPTWSQKQF